MLTKERLEALAPGEIFAEGVAEDREILAVPDSTSLLKTI